MSNPRKADQGERDRDRKFIILAILACLLMCGGIVSYFYWQNHKRARGAEYAMPRAVPVEPVPPPSAPPPPPARKETREPPTVAPTKEIAPVKPPAKGLIPPRPRELTPPDFVYQPIPHDAPLAEFPIVLVWQKRREWYRPPGGGELPISPPPISVIPRPPPKVPPTIPPTEQSPSGL